MGLSSERREEIREARSDARRRARPYVQGPREARAGSSRNVPLTPIELDVLLAAADGLTARETGARLLKGEETVKTQRKAVMAKLDAANMMHAVAIALRRGLIE